MEGELYSPIAELEISAVVELQGSIPQYMNARKLQRFVWRAVDPEGTYHFMKMKWWTRCFIWTSLLALLSSAILLLFWIAGSREVARYVLVGSLLILTWHIAVFSMAALVLRAGWFGVVRWQRQYWLRRLRKQRTKDSSEDTVSRMDIRKLKWERSFPSSKQ
jgi:hypothetical protein